MKKTKTNPSANQNWIATETKNDYHKQAIKKLAEAKQFESEHEFNLVRVDGKTVKLKLVK